MDFQVFIFAIEFIIKYVKWDDFKSILVCSLWYIVWDTLLKVVYQLLMDTYGLKFIFLYILFEFPLNSIDRI